MRKAYSTYVFTAPCRARHVVAAAVPVCLQIMNSRSQIDAEGTDTTSRADASISTSVEDSSFNCAKVVCEAVTEPALGCFNDNTGSMSPVGEVHIQRFTIIDYVASTNTPQQPQRDTMQCGTTEDGIVTGTGPVSVAVCSKDSKVKSKAATSSIDGSNNCGDTLFTIVVETVESPGTCAHITGAGINGSVCHFTFAVGGTQHAQPFAETDIKISQNTVVKIDGEPHCVQNMQVSYVAHKETDKSECIKSIIKKHSK